MVIIKESDNYFYDEALAKEEQKFIIRYEIDIYSINMKQDGKVIPKEIIRKELTNLINDVLDVHYGFNRKQNLNLPNIDENVDRQYLSYEAIVDENKKIFRR